LKAGSDFKKTEAPLKQGKNWRKRLALRATLPTSFGEWLIAVDFSLSHPYYMIHVF